MSLAPWRHEEAGAANAGDAAAPPHSGGHGRGRGVFRRCARLALHDLRVAAPRPQLQPAGQAAARSGIAGGHTSAGVAPPLPARRRRHRDHRLCRRPGRACSRRAEPAGVGGDRDRVGLLAGPLQRRRSPAPDPADHPGHCRARGRALWRGGPRGLRNRPAGAAPQPGLPAGVHRRLLPRLPVAARRCGSLVARTPARTRRPGDRVAAGAGGKRPPGSARGTGADRARAARCRRPPCQRHGPPGRGGTTGAGAPARQGRSRLELDRSLQPPSRPRAAPPARLPAPSRPDRRPRAPAGSGAAHRPCRPGRARNADRHTLGRGGAAAAIPHPRGVRLPAGPGGAHQRPQALRRHHRDGPGRVPANHAGDRGPRRRQRRGRAAAAQPRRPRPDRHARTRGPPRRPPPRRAPPTGRLRRPRRPSR